MPNYIKLGNLRIEIPEPANNGGGGGGGGAGLLNGLLAFYNLSDLSDASGNGNTLTNNGDVTFSSGKIGNAATFNGSNWLDVAITNSVKTLSSWIKVLNGSSYNIIAEFDNLQIQFISNGAIRLNGGSGEESFNSGANDGNWHHLSVVFSDSGNFGFLDGVKTTLTTNYISMVNRSNVAKGVAFGATIGGQYDRWSGQLDSIGLWNRALSDAEVTELYNAAAGKEHPFA
jgi:hypothetical protein